MNKFYILILNLIILLLLNLFMPVHAQSDDFKIDSVNNTDNTLIYESAYEIVLIDDKNTFKSDNKILNTYSEKNYYNLVRKKNIPDSKFIDLIVGIFSLFLILNVLLPKIFYNKNIKFNIYQ